MESTIVAEVALPDAIWESIFTFCVHFTILQASVCCRQLHAVVRRSSNLARQTLFQFYRTTKLISDYNHRYNPPTPIFADIDLEQPPCSPQLLPIFDPVCFNQMTLFAQSYFFHVYARIMSYNWRLHLMVDCHFEDHEEHERGPFSKDAVFGYLDGWEKHLNSTDYRLNLLDVDRTRRDFVPRGLNTLETRLFTIDPIFSHPSTQSQLDSNKPLVTNIDGFTRKMEDNFYLSQWSEIIFPRSSPWISRYSSRWSDQHCAGVGRFFLAGGSVLECIRNPDRQQQATKQKDLDFFAVGLDNGEFNRAVKDIQRKLMHKGFVSISDIGAPKGEYQHSCVQNIFVNFSKSPTNVRIGGKRQEKADLKWEQQFPQKQLCPFYGSAKGCNPRTQYSYHTSCGYSHDMPQSIKLCSAIARGNRCPNGDECSYRHKLYNRDILKENVDETMCAADLLEQNKQIIKQERFWTQLQFIWVGKSYEDWSVLHIFDLDCCQVGFDGRRVLCTHAFQQSLTTNTMINYKLSNNSTTRAAFLPRIQKYFGRGFDLITPRNFESLRVFGDLCPESAITVAQETASLYKIFHDSLRGLFKWSNFRQMIRMESPRKALQSLFQDASDEEMAEKLEKADALKMTAARSSALYHLFRHSAVDVTALYGTGGFGFNNDCLGARKNFMAFLEEIGAQVDVDLLKQLRGGDDADDLTDDDDLI